MKFTLKRVAFAAALLWSTWAGANPAHWAQVDPALQKWFGALRNQTGQVCCAGADGLDVEWDTKDLHYRVRLDKVWVVVPDESVVTVPNRLKMSKVWLRPDGTIRCFMPGAEG